MRRLRWPIIIALLLAVWLGFGWLRRSAGPHIEPGSTLVLRLRGAYVEAPQPSLLARLAGSDSRPFVGVLSQLAKAERDDRIATVVLRIESMDIGWGKAEELRRAIGRLRDAGRRTVGYLELGGLSVAREYYVASAADRVHLVPGGAFPLLGLSAEYIYLGGLWEKLGIDFEVARAGRYKSAVETLAGRGMSEASREMANSLLDSTERLFVEGIASGRDLSADQVREAIDRGPVQGSELVELGLADSEAHLDAVLDGLDAPVVKGSDYARVDPEDVGFDPVARFALVYGSGQVVTGDGGRTPGGAPVFAADPTVRAIEQAAEAKDIDAIIVRIDSPGGSSLASELIWRAIERAKQKSGKPVVASFSDVAASGGYYVAAAADEIVAPAGTLTGSIGVFALRPVLGGLFEKLGLGVETLTRGEHADFLLLSQPLDEGARDRLQRMVLDTYDLFVSRVAEGRGLERAEVDAIGQGRVWTGEQARERGLVDEIGGLREAAIAAKRASGLAEDADVALVPYPTPRSLAEELFDLLEGRVDALALLQDRIALPTPLASLARWIGNAPPDTPLLVPPLWVEIR